MKETKGKITLDAETFNSEVHPNQVSNWKKQFLASLPQIFDNSKQPQRVENEELTNQLYQQIGQLKVELDWLKKKSSLFS